MRKSPAIEDVKTEAEDAKPLEAVDRQQPVKTQV
jgi:hypothetical protein